MWCNLLKTGTLDGIIVVFVGINIVEVEGAKILQ